MTELLVDHDAPAVRLLAAQRPDIPGAVDAHFAAAAAVLGPELTGLIRARVGGLMEGREAAVEAGAPQLERAVVEFTDQFFHSPQWVTDAHVDAILDDLEPGRAFAVAVVVSLTERWYRMARMLSAFAEL